MTRHLRMDARPQQNLEVQELQATVAVTSTCRGSLRIRTPMRRRQYQQMSRRGWSSSAMLSHPTRQENHAPPKKGITQNRSSQSYWTLETAWHSEDTQVWQCRACLQRFLANVVQFSTMHTRGAFIKLGVPVSHSDPPLHNGKRTSWVARSCKRRSSNGNNPDVGWQDQRPSLATVKITSKGTRGKALRIRLTHQTPSIRTNGRGTQHQAKISPFGT